MSCALCGSAHHNRSACPWTKVGSTVVLVALFCAPMIYGALMDADRELQEAQEVAAARYSRDWAAMQVCGPNSAHEWRGNDLVCYTHQGRAQFVAMGSGK